MDFLIRTRSRLIAALALLSLIIPLAALAPVSAAGTVQVTMNIPNVASGTLSGTLDNTVIFQNNNSVSMHMIVDGQLPLFGGLSYAHVHSTGMLIGVKNGAQLSGQVVNVVGNSTSFAGNAKFVGQGQWVGSLSGSHGTGTINSTVTFSSAPSPIQVNTPYKTTGTWSADFSTPVPEFGSALPTVMIALTIATFLILRIRERRTKRS